MFAVIFEVQPRQMDAYLGNAKMLKPELEAIDGFVDNIRYKSLTREGWILSLSSWRDEKSLIRWRTQAKHHDVQELGRGSILRDYHLRVGELIADTHVPTGHTLRDQRLDETEVGEGTAIVLVDAKRPEDWVESTPAEEIAHVLGLDQSAEGLVAWDVFDAVLTPGDMVFLATFRTQKAAAAGPSGGLRSRRVRIVRDYGMFDRREAPQFYPAAAHH